MGKRKRVRVRVRLGNEEGWGGSRAIAAEYIFFEPGNCPVSEQSIRGGQNRLSERRSAPKFSKIAIEWRSRNRLRFPTSQLVHMRFKYFLVPILAIIGCGALQ